MSVRTYLFQFDLQQFAEGDAPADGGTATEDVVVDDAAGAKLDDHAKRVIAKANAEAKKHREAREAAEAASKAAADELATLRKKNADAEAEELAKNNKFKELAEKLAIEKAELEKAIETEKEANAKALETERKAREEAAVYDAVQKAAIKAGIIDEELVDIFDLSGVTVKDGKVDKAAVEALIAAKKEEKPKLFEAEREDRARDDQGRFQRPNAKSNAKGDIDWSALSDEEFARKEREIIRSKV